MQREDDKYLNTLINQAKDLKLLIVGQDPYPKGATGIAFCKTDKTDLFSNSCSGRFVLNSLGFNEKNTSNFKNGEAIFLYLLEKGVAFINVSNLILRSNWVKGIVLPIVRTDSKLLLII